MSRAPGTEPQSSVMPQPPPQTGPRLSITGIWAKKLLCPLTEPLIRERVTRFSISAYRVWNGQTSKAAILSSDNLSIYLNVGSTGSEITKDTKFTVSATWVPGAPDAEDGDEGDDGAKPFVVETEKSWDPEFTDTNLQIAGQVLSDGRKSKSLPWALTGKIYWKLQVKTGPATTTKTSIELYVLPPYIPAHMKRTGLPRELLRYDQLLKTWMTIDDNNWVKYATERIFKDRRLCYDNFCGASTYTTIKAKSSPFFAIPDEATFWIDLWLADMNGTSKTPGTDQVATYPINCLDAAALVQTIASMNLGGPYAESRMIYMSNFGYIYPTYLIGRHQAGAPGPYKEVDLCNNPFYKDVTKMSVGPTDPARTAFGCHYFVSIDEDYDSVPKVFDACCGPQLGAKSLDGYIQDCIDSTDKIYAPTPGRPARGKLENAYSFIGVKSLSTAASFRRQKLGRDYDDDLTLFGRMNKVFGSAAAGRVRAPFIGSPASAHGSITATWTYVRVTTEVRDECQISIWRYGRLVDAQSEYQRRRMAMTDYKELTGTEPKNDLTFEDSIVDVPGYFMFWHGTASQGFLVVIEGRMENKKIQTIVAKPIKENVLDVKLEGRTIIQKTTVPPGAQKKNIPFEVTIKPSQVCRSWWTGVKVDTDSGNALFISSQVNDDEEVVLEFLPRSAGNDIAYVTLYGPNLDVASTYFGIFIKK